MKVCLLVVLLFSYSTIVAQVEEQKHLFYVNGGYDIGNYFGGRLGINYIYKERYYAHIGNTILMRRAKNTPPGYRADYFDGFGSYDVKVGKIKPLNSKGTIRLNLRGGLSYVQFEEITFLQNQMSAGSLGNYKISTKEINTVGVILEPTFEFPVSRAIGLSLTAYTHLNTETAAVGLSANLLLGLVRKRKSM